MNSTEEILKSIIEEYKEIQTSSHEQLLEKCGKIQQSLIVIIKRHLVNTDDIIVEIQCQSSQTQTVLNFLHYLIDGLPPPAFVLSMEQFRSNKESDADEHIKVYLEFLYFLVSHLLQLSVNNDLNSLHETANKTILSLLNLIKCQNPKIYQCFLEEFTDLLIELFEIEEENFLIEGSNSCATFKIKSFCLLLPAYNDVSDLEISSHKNLENWQVACCNLLQMQSDGLILLSRPRFSSLLITSLHQIMFCACSLKIASTKLCSSLLHNGGYVPSEVMETLMNCILSLIDLLYLKSFKLKFATKDTCENEIINCHQALMQFLFNVFAVTYPKTVIVPVSLPKPQLNINFGQLNMMVSHFASVIGKETKWESVVFRIFNFATVCGIKFACSKTDKSFDVVNYSSIISNIAEFCIESWSTFQITATSIELLTNLYSFFCLIQSLVNPVQSDAADEAAVVSNFTTCKRLSRKRPHGSYEAATKPVVESNEHHWFSQFCCSLLKNCDKELSELGQLILHFKHQTQPVHIIVNKLSSGLSSLTLVFQPFLNSLAFLQKNRKCTNLLLTSLEKSNFMTIFGNYVELFIGFVCRLSLQVAEANATTFISIYSISVHLAKLIIMWYHFSLEELKISLSQDNQKILCVINMLISLVWLEDLPWADLKVSFLPNLSKSNLISFSQSLKLSDSCLKNLSNADDEQWSSILHDCLFGLAYLPPNISPQWRHSVLTQWAMSCGASAIESHVLDVLPIYCSKLKLVNIPPVIEILMSFVKNKTSAVENTNVIKRLIDLLSSLTLTITQNFISFSSLMSSPSNFIVFNTRLVEKNPSLIRFVETDFLNLACEIVKSPVNRLNSIEPNKMSPEWNSLCMNLIHSLNSVLKCSNKKRPESQQLLKNLVKLFTLEVTIVTFEPFFLDFDNIAWSDFLLEEVKEAFKNCTSKTSQTNLTLLIGPALFACETKKIIDNVVFSKFFQLNIKLLCSSSPGVRSITCTVMEKFALQHRSMLQTNKYRKLVCHSLIDGLLENEFSRSFALQVFEDASSFFEILSTGFISDNLHHLLPPIIVKQVSAPNSKADELLQAFSGRLALSKSDLISQNFKHIFCYAVTTESNCEKLFEYLEKLTKVKKKSLLLFTHGSLIQHLLAHISVNSERVCNALQYIHQVHSEKNETLPVSELLKPHFLGVLIFFNSQLRVGNVSIDDNLQVYESLIRLLYLLDTAYLTTVCVKVVNTLCLAQQALINSTKSSICCKAWHALVCCVEDSCLGSLLSQVVAMLLPCLEENPNDVANTLEYMIIKMQQHTKSNFAELYFLPNHKSLQKVKSHIDKELRLHRSSAAFLHVLKQATMHLSHDSAEVRMCALEQIRKVLQSNQIALQRNNLVAGGVSDLIQSLISPLLTCCRDGNSKIKLLAAKCLGETGAVDPDKLNFIVTSKKSKSETCGSFDDEDFAFDLFNCLVQAFLVAKPTQQDISAYAIQELLRIYRCQEGSKASASGRKLWRRFPEQVQAVLEPHISSKYIIKKSETNLSTLSRPLLHRKQNMTFLDWIGSFCSRLMQMASSVLDKSSTVRRVFDACADVARSNVDVAFFLLPPTVVEVLKSGDECLDFIKEEIMAVLESTQLLQESKKSVTATSVVAAESPGRNCSNIAEAAKVSTLSSNVSLLCAQAVFSVLDHVTFWLQKTAAAHANGGSSRTKLANEKEQASKFLAMIPQKILATASLHCRDYKRALLHFETFLRDMSSSQLQVDSAEFLQRAFIEMNEADGVLGVVNVRGVEPSLETRLLVTESVGALQDAAACYERIICHNPTDMFRYKGFFKCLIDLGQLSEAVSLVDGTISNNPSWKNELASYGVEACWRLGKWDLLEKKVESLSSPEPKSWSVGIGQAILAIREKNWNKLQDILDNLYQSQTDPLSAASMETNSFQRGYDHVLRLHTLSDLERFSDIIRGHPETSSIDDVMSLWQLRLKVVQPSFRACDPVLSLARVMLPLLCNISDAQSSCDRFVGKLWLQTSKLARKSGLLQTAYGALLSAQRYGLPGFCIEHAKWLWKKGESHQALLTLQRGFDEHYSNEMSSINVEQRLERAKVMLLEAKLMEESSSYDSNVVLRKYKEVVSYMGDWEDSHFYCGRYYDKLMTSMMGENRAGAKSQHLYYIMSHYGRSLCFGTKHIYESLTKLLTLWMDYGETATKLEKAGRPQSNEDVQRLVEVISDVRSRLPAYIFYVAFSQLTSRICHQHEPTYNQLKEILVSVILAFPQRALWSMIAISKSSFKQRANRCQEIFERVRYKEPKLAPLITDFIMLTNRLLELCNKPVSNIQPLSIATHFKQLKKLVEGNNFSEIMLPLQKFMNVVLPQSKQNSAFGSQTTHNPFPEATAHIVGFEDAVEILSSLQRPKKISVRASNGQSYSFLCKPKDDLRKDARLTEFAAIVNKCLYRDAESGKRHLRIRSYAVIPLNEECGLIEWVENMKGLRHILLPIYKAKSLYCSGKQLKAWQLPVSAPVQKKLEVFRTKYLPRHPPVFFEWFLTTFADPSSWYNARLAYARSVAVMSMVGYILGLGDRHGENILFDSNSGEAMHVDFNCLFNKGLSLEVPEIVPFRLTHNMVDAMGPTKYEGFFRKACEVTMNVLREQREPLMSVLKTFIYDPLVEWSKKSRGSSSSGEVLSEKALSHVNDIDKRLRGIVGKNKGLPLSIEGHVHYLIQEATDEEKLCQMYIGWAPFM